MKMMNADEGMMVCKMAGAGGGDASVTARLEAIPSGTALPEATLVPSTPPDIQPSSVFIRG